MIGNARMARLTLKQRHAALFGLLATVTVVLGFLEWWTLPLVAFAAAGLLVQKKYSSMRDIVLLTSLAPAFAWVVTAFVRDATEGFRISRKLAGLLHLGAAVFVYVVLFSVALIISAFAAWSGAETSKALR